MRRRRQLENLVRGEAQGGQGEATQAVIQGTTLKVGMIPTNLMTQTLSETTLRKTVMAAMMAGVKAAMILGMVEAVMVLVVGTGMNPVTTAITLT